MGYAAYSPLILGIIVAIGIIGYTYIESRMKSSIDVMIENNQLEGGMGPDNFIIRTCPEGYNMNAGSKITTCDNMDITVPIKSFRLYGPRDDKSCLTMGCFNSKYITRHEKCEALEKYFKDEPDILRNWREIRDECQK